MQSNPCAPWQQVYSIARRSQHTQSGRGLSNLRLTPIVPVLLTALLGFASGTSAMELEVVGSLPVDAGGMEYVVCVSDLDGDDALEAVVTHNWWQGVVLPSETAVPGLIGTQWMRDRL
jgi:hypothetical protein